MQVTRPSPYEEHLERLRERDWTLEDVPFYEPGQPTDFTAYESLHYLDVYDKVWGRECGENGIGRLREVAISLITEAEIAQQEATCSRMAKGIAAVRPGQPKKKSAVAN